MVLIISYFALGETLKSLEIVNMCISFISVLFIVIFSQRRNEEINTQEVEVIASNKSVEYNLEFFLGVLANSTAAFCFSIINVIVRYLKDVHHSIVATFQSTGNFVISLFALMIFRLFISPNGFSYDLTGAEVFLLFLSGLVRSMGMIFFIKAFQLDKAGRAAGLNFLQIITGYSSDMIFFDYSMQVFELIVASVIIICSVMVFVLKAKGYSE